MIKFIFKKISRFSKYRAAYIFYRFKNLIYHPFANITSRLKARFWAVKIGKNVRFLGVPRFRNLGHIKILEGARIISDNRNIVGSEIKTTFQTGARGTIVIGRKAAISNCHLIASDKIIIGDEVYIGGGVRIYDNDFHSSNALERINRPDVIPSKAVRIMPRSFIGGHTLILKGVTIGECAVVGAGSVVTRDIGPYEVWAGNPAKLIKKLTE